MRKLSLILTLGILSALFCLEADAQVRYFMAKKSIPTFTDLSTANLYVLTRYEAGRGDGPGEIDRQAWVRFYNFEDEAVLAERLAYLRPRTIFQAGAIARTGEDPAFEFVEIHLEGLHGKFFVEKSEFTGENFEEVPKPPPPNDPEDHVVQTANAEAGTYSVYFRLDHYEKMKDDKRHTYLRERAERLGLIKDLSYGEQVSIKKIDRIFGMFQEGDRQYWLLMEHLGE